MEINLKPELVAVFDSLGVSETEVNDLKKFYLSRLSEAVGARDTILANIASLQVQLVEAEDWVMRVEQGILKVADANSME